MLTRIAVRAVGAVAVLVLSAPVAHAKGPDSATIEGGGQRVRIVMQDGNQGELLTDLIDVTGFYGIGNVREFEKPPVSPGPGYKVSYDVSGGAAFVQVLYPSTSSGTMIYTPPQSLYGQRLRGGWLDAPVNLTLFLHRYGIRVATPTPTPTPAARASVSDDGGRPVWLAIPIAGFVVLLAGGVYVIRRRSAVSA